MKDGRVLCLLNGQDRRVRDLFAAPKTIAVILLAAEQLTSVRVCGNLIVE